MHGPDDGHDMWFCVFVRPLDLLTVTCRLFDLYSLLLLREIIELTKPEIRVAAWYSFSSAFVDILTL